LSHERLDIAGAEGFHSLEGNMCGTVCEALTEQSAEEAAAAESVERRAGHQGEMRTDKARTGVSARLAYHGAGTHTATVCRLDPRQEPYAGKPHVRIWAGGVR
jgi:hypothetical protein